MKNSKYKYKYEINNKVYIIYILKIIFDCTSTFIYAGFITYCYA